jgi:DNA-binding transcriptional MerR regulator
MLKLYTAQKICDKLGLSIFVLRNWIKQNRGPKCYLTPGGHRRFTEKDVQHWYRNKYVLKGLKAKEG